MESACVSSTRNLSMPIKTHVGAWTTEQKVHDYDTSHLSMCAKYAAASLATPHFTAHNAKGPLRHINCMGHLNFDSEAELSQTVQEIRENFYGTSQQFAVLACINSKPNNAVEILTNLRLPNHDSPLLSDFAIPYMTLDTTKTPHRAPNFAPNHPAHHAQLRVVEVTKEDDKSCEDFTRLVFSSFYAAGTPSQAMLDEHKAKVKNAKRSVAPFFHSFVAYEDEHAVAGGSLLLCPSTGIAGIFEICSDPSYRSKGYGAKLFAHIVQFGLRAGYVRFVLTATALGRAVYERQGFEALHVDGDGDGGPGRACIHYFSPANIGNDKN